MKKIIICSLLALLIVVACWPTKKGSVQTSSITALGVTNNTEDTVTAYLTLGAGELSVTNVNGIFGITDSGLVGSFIIVPHDTLWYYGSDSLQMSGNITFVSPPINCPDTNIFPNGINLFEFTLNNRVIDTTQQETIDISCVAGCNVLGSFSMSKGGKWNASPLFPDVKLFFNDSLYKNYGKVGVYPFGCDNCTVSTAPPVCPGHKPFSKPQSNPICNVQRGCMNSGGKVIIGYGAIEIMK
jgi:hypothetical protein